jgi:hypothetical protein
MDPNHALAHVLTSWLLAEIYGRFTDGIDMADLIEARALIEQLP